MTDTLAEIDKRLSVHEEGCAVRQEAIDARLNRIEASQAKMGGNVEKLLEHFNISKGRASMGAVLLMAFGGAVSIVVNQVLTWIMGRQ